MTVPFPTNRTKITPLERTGVDIRIHKSGGSDIVWEGSAVTVRPADTLEGQDDRVASDLIDALLRTYPARPPEVIGVP